MRHKHYNDKLRRLAVDRLDPRSRAILLLTVELDGDGGHLPLDVTEWSELAEVMMFAGAAPEDLLAAPAREVVPDCVELGIEPQRLDVLMSRETQLETWLTAWRSRGVTTITRADSAYPRRLMSTMGRAAPPVLHLVGNPTLLRCPGIAVIGTRHATQAELKVAAEVSAMAAGEDLVVVTGGAKGSDTIAMQAALESRRGKAIVVLSNSFTKAASSRRYQRHIREQRLLLVSPYAPMRKFASWQAQQRDRYIYCLADAAVVTSCKYGVGATWDGAAENLRQGWVPTWANEAGARALLTRGALPLPRLDGLNLAEDLLPARKERQVAAPVPLPVYRPALGAAKSNLASRP